MIDEICGGLKLVREELGGGRGMGPQMGQHWTFRSKAGHKSRMKLRKLSRGTRMSSQWAGTLWRTW